mmetsp:Transcript_17189/g.39042  ORF Transcript_17189/g.39042 Transcript_17189/m.39042 type:complete len:211 (-) Transcript_17189:60-692(-)
MREEYQVTCRAHLLLWGEKSKPFVMTGGRNEMKQAQVDFFSGFSECLTTPKKSDIEPRSPICETCRNTFYVLGEEIRGLLTTPDEHLERVSRARKTDEHAEDEGARAHATTRLIVYLRELMHVESQCRRVMEAAASSTMGSEVMRVLRSCHNTVEELSFRYSIIVAHAMELDTGNEALHSIVANRISTVGRTLEYNQQCLSCRMHALECL